MNKELIKFAQRIGKAPKDAEIEPDVLVDFVRQLPDWSIEGPVPYWARDKAGNKIRTDEWVRGGAYLKQEEVISAALSQVRSRGGYNAREIAQGVDVTDELPDPDGLTVGAWVLLRPTVKSDSYGGSTVLWQPHKLVQAYVITPPDGDQYVLHSTLDARPVWKSPGFWKWSAQHLKPAAEQFLANTDKFDVERTARPDRQNEDVGTCSVCFHAQVLDRRVSPGGITLDEAWGTRVMRPKAPPRMVLHGYQRPGSGEIYGRCPGIVFQPYELSVEGTEWALAQIEGRHERAKAEYESWQAGAYHGKSLPAHRIGWIGGRTNEVHWGTWSYGTYRKPVTRSAQERAELKRTVHEDATVTADDKVWPKLHGELGARLLSRVREDEYQVALLRKYVKEWKPRPLPGEEPKPASTFSLPAGYVPARAHTGLVHAASKDHPWSKYRNNGLVPACVGSMMALDRTYVTEAQAGTVVTCQRCIKAVKR